MSENTLKAAAVAIVSAVIVAIVGATQQPWWWCDTVGCASRADPPVENSIGNLMGSKPGPEGDEPKFKIIPAVPAHMGDLIMGTNLQGLDINNGEPVQNVQACVKLCAETDQCRAMTYVYATPNDTQNGICWMKGSAPAGQPNPYMISARKIPAEPEKRVPL
jgi:hypothetical protein